MADQFDSWLEAELKDRLASVDTGLAPARPRYLATRDGDGSQGPATTRLWLLPVKGTGIAAIMAAALLAGGTAAVAAHVMGVAPFGAPSGASPKPAATSCPSGQSSIAVAPSGGPVGSACRTAPSSNHRRGTSSSPRAKGGGASPTAAASGSPGHGHSGQVTPGAARSGSASRHGKPSPPAPKASPGGSGSSKGHRTASPRGTSSAHASPAGAGASHASANAIPPGQAFGEAIPNPAPPRPSPTAHGRPARSSPAVTTTGH